MAQTQTLMFSDLSSESKRYLWSLDVFSDEQLAALDPRIAARLEPVRRARIGACGSEPVARSRGPGASESAAGGLIRIVGYPAGALARPPRIRDLPLVRRWKRSGLPLRQGDGECGAYAIASALGLANASALVECFPDPHRLHIESPTAEDGGKGRTLEDLAQTLMRCGYLRRGESSRAWSVRLKRRWLRVPALAALIDDAQVCLRLAADVCTGRIGSPTPIVTALDIAENWQRDRAGMLRRAEPEVERRLGVHAVVVLGVTSVEGRGQVVIGNSWGECFGGQSSLGLPAGVALMSFDHFAAVYRGGLLITQDRIDAWAIRRSASGRRTWYFGMLARAAGQIERLPARAAS